MVELGADYCDVCMDEPSTGELPDGTAACEQCLSDYWETKLEDEGLGWSDDVDEEDGEPAGTLGRR